MLSREQREAFEVGGVVRLPRALPAPDVAAMRARLAAALAAEHGIVLAAPATWRLPRPTGFQRLTRSGAFAAMRSPALCDALDALFGPGGWDEPRHWGQPLLAFPEPGTRWDVPFRGWHLDLVGGASLARCPGVRLFAYLSAVDPRGGGTLAVAGSHRRVAALAGDAPASALGGSAGILRRLARGDRWLRALCSSGPCGDRIATFMDAGTTSGGVPLRVVELTGEPGDVVLMDLRVLHAAAPNVRPAPRLVLGQHVYARA